MHILDFIIWRKCKKKKQITIANCSFSTSHITSLLSQAKMIIIMNTSIVLNLKKKYVGLLNILELLSFKINFRNI